MNEALSAELVNLPTFLVPILIFLARILDVSLGTLRIVLVARGLRAVSSVLGFFEVFIWLLAISQIVQNLTSITNYIAYAAGFAAGTYVGMTIERALSLGRVLVRVIMPREAADLIMYLIARDYRVTHVPAEGINGPVTIIFTIVRRSRLKDVLSVIRKFDPNAFYTVEDIRMASDQATAHSGRGGRRLLWGPFFWFRKAK